MSPDWIAQVIKHVCVYVSQYAGINPFPVIPSRYWGVRQEYNCQTDEVSTMEGRDQELLCFLAFSIVISQTYMSSK